MRHLAPLAALCAALATPLTAADLHFCWRGDNGYTMTGVLSLPDSALKQDLVTEADVTGLVITGYHMGRVLGRWDSRKQRPGATWHLRFDPQTRQFLTGGSFTTDHSQGWNANGSVNDCGNPGFGFNSGNYAQDLCVDGTYIHLSSIDPATPLLAGDAPAAPSCDSRMLLGKRQP